MVASEELRKNRTKSSPQYEDQDIEKTLDNSWIWIIPEESGFQSTENHLDGHQKVLEPRHGGGPEHPPSCGNFEPLWAMEHQGLDPAASTLCPFKSDTELQWEVVSCKRPGTVLSFGKGSGFFLPRPRGIYLGHLGQSKDKTELHLVAFVCGREVLFVVLPDKVPFRFSKSSFVTFDELQETKNVGEGRLFEFRRAFSAGNSGPDRAKADFTEGDFVSTTASTCAMKKGQIGKFLKTYPEGVLSLVDLADDQGPVMVIVLTECLRLHSRRD